MFEVLPGGMYRVNGAAMSFSEATWFSDRDDEGPRCGDDSTFFALDPKDAMPLLQALLDHRARERPDDWQETMHYPDTREECPYDMRPCGPWEFSHRDADGDPSWRRPLRRLVKGVDYDD